MLCGGVAADMLPQHRTAYNHVTFYWILLNFKINVTLARLQSNLPDDGRRPKHVGANSMWILMYNLKPFQV
jgi:hypothetical protein